jgi:N-acyl-D-amino-acid deacylase
VPFTYGALLTFPGGRHLRLLDVNRAGWERGAQVWPQVSPRPLCFTMKMTEPFTLNVNPIFAELIGAPVAVRVQAYSDASWRQKVLDAWTENTRMPPRWDTYVFAESEHHPEVVGRRLLDVAAERGVSPFDALLDLAVDEPTLRVSNFLANDEPDEVARLLVQEHVTLGLSDAGAHVGQLCDAPQATDFLGNWVRDRHIMEIEEAVRRLTSQQADIFGMPDRGRLVPGAWADVVVFDLETVGPGPTRRVADFPAGSERLTADQPTGIRHVLVNGTPIQADGVHDVTARPGQLVRPAARR